MRAERKGNVYCRCCNCQKLFEAQSQQFGKSIDCPACGEAFILDVVHLARFTLPKEIHLRLMSKSGDSQQLGGIEVIARYGYKNGPLFTDNEGKVVFTEESFKKAEEDEINSGLMDHKGFYSLNRFISIKIPKKQVSLYVDLEEAPQVIKREVLI